MAKVDRDMKVIYDLVKDDCGASSAVRSSYTRLKGVLDNGGTENNGFSEDYAFPSDNLFYQFSQAAYVFKNTNECKKRDKQLFKDWYLLKEFKGSTGVRAILFLNIAARQLMLAFKGTSASIEDIKADAQIWKNKNSPHFHSASTIANEVRKTVEDLNGRVQLLITGHSLGGFLAQIATFIVKHRRIENDNFIDLAPNDVEIHAKTVVFDSPPCLGQIIEFAGHDPIDLSLLHLDITTYICKKNKINYFGPRRPQLGTVLLCEPETAQQPTMKDIVKGLVHKALSVELHELRNFRSAGKSGCDLVENIGARKIRKHDPSIVPLSAFSLRELECLSVAPYVQFSGNKSLDLKFNINEFHIKLFHEKVNTFVPKIRILIREEKSRFESVPEKVHAFLKVLMENILKPNDDDEFDIIDIELHQGILANIWQTKGDIFIHHLGIWREMNLFARILQNVTPNFHFMDYNKFKTMENEVRETLLRTLDGTLALLVKDGHAYHHKEFEKKCRFLVISRSKVENLTEVLKIESLCLSHLSEKGRNRLFEYDTTFFGEKVKLKKLYEGALCDSSKWLNIRCIDVLDFSVNNDKEVHSDFNLDIYVPQEITQNRSKGVNYGMDKFISMEIMDKIEHQTRILLRANPGMGKSTYLRNLRADLQKRLAIKGYWVAKICLPDCIETLSKLKQSTYPDQTKDNNTAVDEKAKFDALELIHKHALPKKCSALEKEVLIHLLQRKKVFLLLDAFDEVCPEYRDLMMKLLRELQMQNYDFMVSTRPHEAFDMIYTEKFITKTFELLEFNEASQKIFFGEFFKKKMSWETALKEAENLMSHLKTTKVETDFWGVPLHAVLAAKLFENRNKYSIKAFDNLALLYSEFLDDILSKDVEEKLGLSKARAKSKFSSTKDELKKCLTLAATQLILKIRVMIEPESMQEMLRKFKDDIDATGIANVHSCDRTAEGVLIVIAGYQIPQGFTISFSHTSFAEFLAATYLVDQMQEGKCIERLPEFLSQSQYQFTRRFVNDILEMKCPLTLEVNNEMRGEIYKLGSKIEQILENEKLTSLSNMMKVVFKQGCMLNLVKHTPYE